MIAVFVVAMLGVAAYLGGGTEAQTTPPKISLNSAVSFPVDI